MATINATQDAEVTYITGVTSAGTVAPTSFWTWNNNTPATYGASSDEAKWGVATAGVGATITYAFNPAANWTPTEQSAFATTMTLWSAFANVNFTNVGLTTSAEVVIGRATDGTAEGGITSFYPSSIGSAHLGSAVSGEIDIDTSVAGFGPLGSSLGNFGGYPWLTLLHEEGHVLGLGHGGPYDEGTTTASPQYTAYDTRAYSVMSYNDPTDVNWGVTQASNGRYYDGDPTTPMILDIAAVQRLYGLPTTTPFSGGQVFGFHTNITGPTEMFYDFNVNTQPVVTIWDEGTGNVLDLSGFSSASTVNLNQGTFSSVAGLTNNLGIAYGAAIDQAVGGSGNDVMTANPDGDTIFAGAGDDTLYGGSGHDALYGNAGNDVIHLQGSGTMFGGQGNDVLMANDTGAHYVSGDLGNDTITSSGLAGDSLYGGQGNDVITAVDNATVFGGQGNDVIDVSGGGASHHLISGDLGNDQITDTSAGGDTLAGGAGADMIMVATGRGAGDIFLFHAGDSTATSVETNLDHISGFTSGLDHLSVANHDVLVALGQGQNAVFYNDAAVHTGPGAFTTEAQAYQAAYGYAYGGSNFSATVEYLEVHETYGGTNITYVFGHDGFGVGLIGQASALASGDIVPGS